MHLECMIHKFNDKGADQLYNIAKLIDHNTQWYRTCMHMHALNSHKIAKTKTHMDQN